MKSVISLAFILAFSSLGAENERSCRIIFPTRPQHAPEEAYLYDGKTSRKVALPSMNFSDVIPLASGHITLMLSEEAVLKGGEIPQGAPQTVIPEEVKDVYLVISSDPENSELPVKITLIDAGDAWIKPGQTLWLNLSDHRIEGMLGSHVLSIDPGKQVVTQQPMEGSGYYKAEFRYQPRPEEPFLTLMRKSWWLDIQSKNLGFIMPSEAGVPRIFAFRDYRISTQP